MKNNEGKEINTAIEIASSPENVWRIVTDLQNYSRWNPFVQYIIGELREQTDLKALIRLSQKQYPSKVKILRLASNTELGWMITIPRIRLGRFTFLLTEIEQTFLIKQLTNNQGVRFVQKALFRGIRSNAVKKRLAFRMAFEEMNCALKTVVEETNLRACNNL